jgi:hypothetical protein
LRLGWNLATTDRVIHQGRRTKGRHFFAELNLYPDKKVFLSYELYFLFESNGF